jgi:hypothetical protein
MKILGVDVSEDFCEAIDFMFKAILRTSALTFAEPRHLANLMISMITNPSRVPDNPKEREFRLELLETLSAIQ